MPHEIYGSYRNDEKIGEKQIYDILNPADAKGNIICIFGIGYDNIVEEIYDFEKEHLEDYTVFLHPYNVENLF